MLVSDISQLRLVEVLERGVPYKECIAIQANEAVNMGQYGLMVGAQHQPTSALPIKDNLFWFGDGVIDKNDWILVYTCSGDPTLTKSKDGNSNIYVVHWGRPHVIFSHSNVVPILFRVDAVIVGSTPPFQPQLPHP